MQKNEERRRSEKERGEVKTPPCLPAHGINHVFGADPPADDPPPLELVKTHTHSSPFFSLASK